MQGCNVILSLIHFGFCVLQMVSNFQDHNSAPSARIYIIIATLLSSIPVILRGVFIVDSQDMAASINISIPFFRNYQSMKVIMRTITFFNAF